MSVHLILCAKAVTGLPASHKLLLLCFAENARDGGRRIASPGLEEAMEWTGLSRSRVLAATRNLEELRLVEQVTRGQKHQRSAFQVFPDGCCEAHGRDLSASRDGDPEALVEEHRPAVSGSRLQDAETASQPCGLSRHGHPENGSGSRSGGSGSRFDPLRVSLARPLPSTNSPTELPPGSPSNHSPEQPARWPNVIDLDAHRPAPVGTLDQHVGHALTVTAADFVCHDCHITLSITAELDHIESASAVGQVAPSGPAPDHAAGVAACRAALAGRKGRQSS